MSQLDLGTVQRQPGRRRRRKQSRGCIPVLIAALVIALIGGLLYVKGVDVVKGWLDDNSAAADYSGDGTGTVTIEVKDGQTATDIAAHPLGRWRGQERRRVRRRGDGQPAVDVDPGRVLSAAREDGGQECARPDPRHEDVDGLESADHPRGQARRRDRGRHRRDGRLLARSRCRRRTTTRRRWGFPRTRATTPRASSSQPRTTSRPTPPRRRCSRRWSTSSRAAPPPTSSSKAPPTSAGRPTRCSPSRAWSRRRRRRPQDLAKVASVIYNRLDAGMPLQLDSTLHYAVDSRGVIGAGDLTQIDSPYNTYQLTGLPPTPIDSPGDDAINAALHPADTTYLVLRDGQPAHRQDAVREHLRRAPAKRRDPAPVLRDVR